MQNLIEKSKVKGLFDHIKMIKQVQDPEYIDPLSDEDLKSFNQYMIFKVLSMDESCIEVVCQLSKFVNVLPNKQFYMMCIQVIPKNYKYTKYIKPEKFYKFELLSIISTHFNISNREAVEYCNVLGDTEIKQICGLYGKSEKEIKALL